MKLEALGSLDGMMNICYQRKDLPIMHVIVKAPPGSKFQIGDHFDVCEVCKFHKVTLLDFHRFMTSN